MKHIYSFFLLSLSALTLVCAADIDIVRERRYSVIVGATTGATSIPAWYVVLHSYTVLSSWVCRLSTLGPDGKWPVSEIDYTTGCAAQNATWPAQEHWERINTFAAAWHGGLKNALQYVGDPDLRASISLALQFWFSNDFTDPACLDAGGTSTCPCGTPGFWNENWFSNVSWQQCLQ